MVWVYVLEEWGGGAIKCALSDSIGENFIPAVFLGT